MKRTLLLGVLAAAVGGILLGSAGRLMVVLLALLVVPGYLLDRLLSLRLVTPFARPAVWLALSISVVAILYQVATFLGLHQTPSVLTALLLLGILAAVALAWQELGTTASAFGWNAALAAWLALLAVLALTGWTRIRQISELAFPPWVDSVHHALLIRIVAERGQAPLSLLPYLPVMRLPYHWGYHVLIAAGMQLADVPLLSAMLWSGQLLNTLQVLTAAALAAGLTRRRLAGVVAALVVGLISIMPAYYLSWGRYTQLTGLLLLPAIALLWRLLLREPSRGRSVALAIGLAGLSLVHMRVMIFTLALLAVDAGLLLWQRPFQWRPLLGRSLRVAGLAFLLAAPWLLMLAWWTLQSLWEKPTSQFAGGSYNALSDGLLWAGKNRWLVALALLGALLGVRWRQPLVAVLVGWVGLLVILANPWLLGYLIPAIGLVVLLVAGQERRWRIALLGVLMLAATPLLLRLPYLSLMTIDSIVISLFLPLAVMLGAAACWLSERLLGRLPASRRRWVQLAATVLLLVLAVRGAWDLRQVVNPKTVLAKPADLAAMTWVEQHTAPDARFLVGAAGWLPTAERGTDGGWWLLPLAARWVSTPPVLFVYSDPATVAEVRERTRTIAAVTPETVADLYALIKRDAIDYVYIGANPGPLQPAMFPPEQGFRQVYAAEGVQIFAVDGRVP